MMVGEAAATANAALSGRVRTVSTRANSLMSFRRLLPAAGLLVAVVFANWLTNPDSISNFGLELLLAPAIPVALASLAQMFVVLGGDFDVGVGSAVGLVNVITATTMVHDLGLSLVMLLMVVAGYVLIAILREYTAVPSVVLTLGASFVWLGIGLQLQPTPGGQSPAWLTNSLGRSLPLVPEPVWVALALIVGATIVLRGWRYGVVLRGLGANPEAVAQAGRSARLPRLVLWAIAGVCVVLAGLFVTVVSGGSDVNASSTLTLSSFATLVVGGCEMSGGIVEPAGVVLASLALSLISSLLTFENISASWVTAATGFILIAAMSVRRLLSRTKGSAQ